MLYDAVLCSDDFSPNRRQRAGEISPNLHSYKSALNCWTKGYEKKGESANSMRASRVRNLSGTQTTAVPSFLLARGSTPGEAGEKQTALCCLFGEKLSPYS